MYIYIYTQGISNSKSRFDQETNNDHPYLYRGMCSEFYGYRLEGWDLLLGYLGIRHQKCNGMLATNTMKTIRHMLGFSVFLDMNMFEIDI